MKYMVIVVLIVLGMLITPAFGEKTAKDWVTEGYNLIPQGRYDEALNALNEAVKIGDPKDDYTIKNAYMGIANVYEHQNKLQDAINTYDTLLSLFPNNPAFLRNKEFDVKALACDASCKAKNPGDMWDPESDPSNACYCKQGSGNSDTTCQADCKTKNPNKVWDKKSSYPNCGCICDKGYQEDDNGKCKACDEFCTAKNQVYDPDKSVANQCSCKCEKGYQDDNGKCKACDEICKATNGVYDSEKSEANKCACKCDKGYQDDNGKCKSCDDICKAKNEAYDPDKSVANKCACSCEKGIMDDSGQCKSCDDVCKEKNLVYDPEKSGANQCECKCENEGFIPNKQGICAPAEDVYIERLSSPYPIVRSSAAKKLGEIKSKKAVDILIQTLKNDNDANVRNEAIIALGKIGDPKAVDSLLSAVNIADTEGIAMISLTQIKGPEAADAFIRHLEDLDTRKKEVAIDCLGRMGSSDKETVNKITDALLKYLNENSDNSGRIEVIVALEMLGNSRQDVTSKLLEITVAEPNSDVGKAADAARLALLDIRFKK